MATLDRWITELTHPAFATLQLNQQKGTASQDLSFLKEASPIYVTSLSGGNSVTTSSSTTATGGTSNELIVADSSEYARAQQDQVLRVRTRADTVFDLF